MKQSKFRKYSILGQLGIWVILFMIYFMEEMDYSGILISTLFALSTVVCLVGAVYTHYYAVLPLLKRGKKQVYFFLTFMLITLFSIALSLINNYFPFGYDPELTFWGEFIYNFFLITLIVASSSLFYFVEEWFKNIERESLLKNEKLQAELNFLKSQINPHFLFNTLNNIYSYAQTGNQKTAPMLERLSSILRFIVYDCSEDRVGLTKEITAVEDLLEIHKMKNSEQRNIELSVEGVKGYHLIAPLIIVNFVENACKHSDVVGNPKGFIHVQISVDSNDNCLTKISNSFKKKVAINSKYGGVGLENIKKRLDLQYDESYTFEEKKSANAYHLKLNIPLERKK